MTEKEIEEAAELLEEVIEVVSEWIKYTPLPKRYQYKTKLKKIKKKIKKEGVLSFIDDEPDNEEI